MFEARTVYALRPRTDLAVYSAEGRLQLVVEVRSRTGAPSDWAAEFRGNLLANGAIPDAPYFLMALPDHFYLWRDSTRAAGDVLPDYEVDPAPLLSPYLDDELRLSGRLSNSGLHLAVSAWLRDLIWRVGDPTALAPEAPWLVDSGLYSAVRGGMVVSA